MKSGKIILIIFISAFLVFNAGLTIKNASLKDYEIHDHLNIEDLSVDTSGLVLKVTGSKLYYCDENIYYADDKNTFGRTPASDAVFEIEQMKYLKSICDAYGIQLLYVNAPLKYTDDEKFWKEFGIRTYANTNADLFLQGLKENNIPYIDIREKMVEAGIDCNDAFYKSDHHWKTETGKWVATLISDYVNDNFDAAVPDILKDESLFEKRTFEGIFLGEQGMKLSKNLVDTDTYEIIYPNFETSFTINNNGMIKEGDFTEFFESYVGYYAYLGPNASSYNIQNNNLNNGKVTILGDSLTNAVAPFLALEMGEVEILNPRILHLNGVNKLDAVVSSGCNLLVVMYSEGAIGAYANSDSANFPMFSFTTD